MGNVAREIIVPDVGVFRIVFLYVGQGEATLLVIPDGPNFKYVLIDTNEDKERGGINITRLLEDLLDNGLDVFINTHPHKDHLQGIKNVHESCSILEVWHSGHVPGEKDCEAYEEMKDVIEDIGEDNEYILFGTNDFNKIRCSDKQNEVIRQLGDVDFIVLSPAEYVTEEIDNLDGDARRKKIHEQCSVLKFTYGGNQPKHVMITGDADKNAWKDHIVDYHLDKLPSNVLAAVHHGSRSFFKNSKEDEEVYEKHIQEIEPSHLIVSAPEQSESPHEHPHDDAMALYKRYLDEDDIHHLGKSRECVIVDITSDGILSLKYDQELVKEYGFSSDDGDNGKTNAAPYVIGSQTSRIDKKPMG